MTWRVQLHGCSHRTRDDTLGNFVTRGRRVVDFDMESCFYVPIACKLTHDIQKMESTESTSFIKDLQSQFIDILSIGIARLTSKLQTRY